MITGQAWNENAVRKILDNHRERAHEFDRLASELAAPNTVVKLGRCAACRNFDD